MRCVSERRRRGKKPDVCDPERASRHSGRDERAFSGGHCLSCRARERARGSREAETPGAGKWSPQPEAGNVRRRGAPLEAPPEFPHTGSHGVGGASVLGGVDEVEIVTEEPPQRPRARYDGKHRSDGRPPTDRGVPPNYHPLARGCSGGQNTSRISWTAARP